MNEFTKIFYALVYEKHGLKGAYEHWDYLLLNTYNNYMNFFNLSPIERMVKHGFIDGNSGHFTDLFLNTIGN